MLLNNINFKTISLLCFLSFCYPCNGNNELNVKFSFDYLIDFHSKQIFNYTNTTDKPILIKIHQNSDINLEIYTLDGLKKIDTPGHKIIPEFLIIEVAKSARFSIIPNYENQNKVIVNFEQYILNSNDFQIWSRLFEYIQTFTKGDLKYAAVKLNELGDELKVENNTLMFETYFMSAVSYYDAQFYDQALDLFDLIIKSNNSFSYPLKAITLNYKARTLSIKGFKLKAIKLFSQSSKLYQQTNDIRGYASSLNNIGLSYHLLGKLDLAEKFYNEALEAYESIKDKKAVANQYINLGGLYFMKGLNAQAVEFYNRAIGLSKKINNISVEADALEMFAWLQQSQGNYRGLLQKWANILEIRNELNDSSGMTRAYRLIGQSYLSYGNNVKALQFLNKSLERTKQVTLTENYPVLLNNIAQASFNLNRIELSRKYYQQALDYNLSVKNQFYAANDYLGLAKIHMKIAQEIKNKASDLYQLNIQKSHEAIDKSINIYKISDNKLNLVNAILIKTRLFYTQNDLSKALELIEYARQLSKYFNENSAITEINLLNGEIFLAQNKPHEAIKLFKKVLIDAEKQRNQIINPKYRATFAANLEKCRNLLVKTLISESNQTNTENYITEALIISESGKARSLNDLIALSKIPNETKVSSQQKQLQAKLQTLYFLRADLQSKPHLKKINLIRINQEIQQVLFNLDVIYEGNKVQLKKSKIDNNRITQLQRNLPSKTMIVAFRLIDSESYAWHIQKSNISIVVLPAKAQIEKRLETVYKYFKNAPYGIKRYPQSVKIANNWLLDNVFKGIDFDALNKLVISPHGRMQLLPVASLQKHQTELIKNTQISFTPSIMMSKDKKKFHTKFNQLLVVADPITGNDAISKKRSGEFSRLKYSADEALYVAKLYGKEKVKLLLGKNSNKQNVITELTGQYDLIHFATHGLIDPEVPEMSGLVLSSDKLNKNEVLTIGEIMNSKIQSNTVVLSACETAIGENIREEGLIGLSYAFLAAGANQVYATLWKIGDRSTLKSIKKMYVLNNDNIDITIKDPFWVKFEIL